MADVELKSVSKKFGNTEVLHSVDLRVEDQEFVVFVGNQSGMGALRMIALCVFTKFGTPNSVSIAKTHHK